MSPEQARLIEQLHREWFGKLVAYASSILDNPDEAQDVVQDTFHQALIQADLLLKHENPAGWLYLTLRHKIQEYRKARRRRLARFLSLDGIMEQSERRLPEHLRQEFQEPDDSESIQKQVQRALTDGEYRLLTRLVFDRAGHLQVSKEFGISVFACQKRLERIRKKLGGIFPDYRRGRKK